MTCKWDEFTGIRCEAEATCILHDNRRNIDVPVCKEHYDEFRKDKAEGLV